MNAVDRECPFSSELERLLGQPSNDASWRAIEPHLESCSACRNRLAAFSDIGTLVPSQSSQWRAAPSSAALDQAMEQLRREGPAPRTPIESGGFELRLPFLRPTDKPGFLGRLGNYEVRRVIGHGGAGMVLEALDPLLKRTVAIKMLSPWGVLDEEAKQRFLREAQSAAALIHENVVTIHAVEQVDGLPYLVLEYVPGETLHDRVRREGKLPLAEVISIGAQVAKGLAAAHSRSLVHRDIKPANLLLVEDTSRAKIADFGLAKSTGEDSLTLTGTLLGTPEFMSPEQAMRQEPDERSDIFSLGAVLYFMATGVSPFRGSSLPETLANVHRCQPRPLHQINPSLPDWFCELVHRLLARDPQQRLGWASAVAEVLTQSGSADTIAKSPPADVTIRDLSKPMAAGQKNNKQLLVPTALTGILLMGALVWWLLSGTTPTQPVRAPTDAIPAEPTTPRPPEVKLGFMIAGRNDVFNGLAKAVAAAQDRDVIEIHGNGPFLTPPLSISGKRLTIRASIGSHPLLLSETPSGASTQPLVATDSDLRLEGLEIHWAMEPRAGITESDMLGRSIITCTHGRLALAHCRIVSERASGCVAGACHAVLLHRCHLQAKNGMGVFWRLENGGQLAMEGCILENYFAVVGLAGLGATGSDPIQIRLANNTLSAFYSLQLILESAPRQPIRFAADRNVVDANNFVFLMMGRLPPRVRAAIKGEEPIEALRKWVAWSEADNVYRRGMQYLVRPTAAGAPKAGYIESADRWLELWQLPAQTSIEGEIQFKARPRSSKTSPLVLDAVNEPSGLLPADVGARADKVGPGAAYDAWRQSAEYGTWPSL